MNVLTVPNNRKPASVRTSEECSAARPGGKKILHFLEQSDTSRYYDKLFRHFQRLSRNEFHVASLRPADAFFAQIEKHVHTTASFERRARYYASVGEMISLLRRIQPDLVHAHEVIPAFYAAAALLLSGHRAKLVYHRHHNRTIGWKLKLLDLVAAAKATKIVTVSSAMAELTANEHRFARSKIASIHNGIDLDDDTADQAAPTLPEHAARGTRVLLLGRLRPEKGHRIALDAIERVRVEVPEVSLFFAGTGALESELRADVEKRDLAGTVFFLGHVADIAGLLQQVDIVIVPSLRESFGLAAVEAMAAKRLVIASRVGGLPEIVEDGETGALVAPGSADELAHRICYFIAHERDRNRLGANGYRRHRERFTSEAMARSYLSLYEELLGVG